VKDNTALTEPPLHYQPNKMKGNLVFAQDEFHYVTIIYISQSGIARVQRVLPTIPYVMGGGGGLPRDRENSVNLISSGKRISSNKAEQTKHYKSYVNTSDIRR
jgi:hypothetical protein